MKIFSVYDSKAEAFINPTFFPTTAMAVRMFEAAANNPEHDFHRFGGDYTLFELGEWEEKTGEILMYGTTINLGLAITFTKELTHA